MANDPNTVLCARAVDDNAVILMHAASILEDA